MQHFIAYDVRFRTGNHKVSSLLSNFRGQTERTQARQRVHSGLYPCPDLSYVGMMDELDDDEIRELWALHFPKRFQNIRSRFICHIFRRVVEGRAAHSCANEDALMFQLNHVLDRIGISREEFYQVEKEGN